MAAIELRWLFVAGLFVLGGVAMLLGAALFGLIERFGAPDPRRAENRVAERARSVPAEAGDREQKMQRAA
jgi:hypothetical protein